MRIQLSLLQPDIKETSTAPAGVAQVVGHCPANWKAACLIAGQGTCPGCGIGPGLGVYGKQLINVSFLP